MDRSEIPARSLILLLPFLLLTLGGRACLADSSDNSGDDQTTTKYYWQGTQINNLGRLSQGSPNFEQEQRNTRLGMDKEEYLAKIRSQMAHQAATDAQTKDSLALQGLLKTNVVEIRQTPSGPEVTLHADMLFDDNSAAIKIGAVDVLNRLRPMLQPQGEQPVQLVIADRLDEDTEAKDVDAERTLLILGLLEFPGKHASQEDLNPEQLATQ